MEASIFKSFITKYFPSLAKKITEKVNDKAGEIQYEHKKYLKKEFSPDMKFHSLTTNTSIVAADVVALDSPLPLKSRGALAAADGEIPKLGMKKSMSETMLQQLKNLKARGKRELDIVKKLFSDAKDSVKGVYERLDFMFLQSLSTGVTSLDDTNNIGQTIRVDFGVPAKNQFGAAHAWSLATSKPIDDIERVVNDARDKGNTLKFMWIDKVTFNIFKAHDQVKQAFAGFLKTDSNYIFRITKDDIQKYFDEEFGLTIIVIDKVCQIEKGGVKTGMEPWKRGNVTFTTTTDLGTLTYGELAEVDHPVKDVEYGVIDDFILVSLYRTNDPLKENTSVQALVIPVLDNVDSIFMLDTTEAQEIDAGETEGDTTITIWGDLYLKAEVITSYETLTGKDLAADITDAALIEAINELSDEEEELLKDDLTVHVPA